MSEILDLATNFNKASQDKAKNIEQTLEQDLQRLRHSMQARWNESEAIISKGMAKLEKATSSMHSLSECLEQQEQDTQNRLRKSQANTDNMIIEHQQTTEDKLQQHRQVIDHLLDEQHQLAQKVLTAHLSQIESMTYQNQKQLQSLTQQDMQQIRITIEKHTDSVKTDIEQAMWDSQQAIEAQKIELKKRFLTDEGMILLAGLVSIPLILGILIGIFAKWSTEPRIQQDITKQVVQKVDPQFKPLPAPRNQR